MKKMVYYFDFMSPYSFFSWFNVQKLVSERGLEVSYKPVVLARLLNSVELKGPGEITAKREFMLRQCFRYAYKNNIDFTTPKAHPFNPLYALRLATKACAGDNQIKVIETLWRAGWQKRIDLAEPDELVAELSGAGLDGDALLENSYSREAKLEVKSNTKEAIANGAFGVPTFIVDNEFFWGNDSLEDIINKLDDKDEWNRNRYQEVLANTPRGAGDQKL
jgi:2-hydroxychromene-2-carboxylate isomerase